MRCFRVCLIRNRIRVCYFLMWNKISTACSIHSTNHSTWLRLCKHVTIILNFIQWRKSMRYRFILFADFRIVYDLISWICPCSYFRSRYGSCSCSYSANHIIFLNAFGFCRSWFFLTKMSISCTIIMRNYIVSAFIFNYTIRLDFDCISFCNGLRISSFGQRWNILMLMTFCSESPFFHMLYRRPVSIVILSCSFIWRLYIFISTSIRRMVNWVNPILQFWRFVSIINDSLWILYLIHIIFAIRTTISSIIIFSLSCSFIWCWLIFIFSG